MTYHKVMRSVIAINEPISRVGTRDLTSYDPSRDGWLPQAFDYKIHCLWRTKLVSWVNSGCKSRSFVHVSIFLFSLRQILLLTKRIVAIPNKFCLLKWMKFSNFSLENSPMVFTTLQAKSTGKRETFETLCKYSPRSCW